ncbi:MAG: hypothetical protein KC912_25300 [Proteobacteria bacterium]|nr:hypothetical protein [Pseudomonadota bacterium]
MSRSVAGAQAIARRVILMLLAVLLVALPAGGGDLQGVGAGYSSEEGCDCCPDKTPGDGEDCCDSDGGVCCVSGTSVALLAIATHSEEALLPTLESRALMPTHLLLPRAQGPPPTPPPIG